MVKYGFPIFLVDYYIILYYISTEKYSLHKLDSILLYNYLFQFLMLAVLNVLIVLNLVKKMN